VYGALGRGRSSRPVQAAQRPCEREPRRRARTGADKTARPGHEGDEPRRIEVARQRGGDDAARLGEAPMRLAQDQA